MSDYFELWRINFMWWELKLKRTSNHWRIIKNESMTPQWSVIRGFGCGHKDAFLGKKSGWCKKRNMKKHHHQLESPWNRRLCFLHVFFIYDIFLPWRLSGKKTRTCCLGYNMYLCLYLIAGVCLACVVQFVRLCCKWAARWFLPASGYYTCVLAEDAGVANMYWIKVAFRAITYLCFFIYKIQI